MTPAKQAAHALVREMLAPREGRSALEIDELAGPDLPEPYRRLLVHERDMTSELQRYLGQTIHIRPLHVERSGDVLERRVLLVGDDDERTIELGAIRIHLARFADAAREEVLACRTPLGAILARHSVPYRCEPRMFFRLRGSTLLRTAYSLDADTPLYGRANDIVNPRGEPLAEVVEVLPPLDAQG